jgi:ATP-binding cassette subfamily C (CFTR/MRP) protein 4
MVDKLLKAKLLFFEMNPIGRILTRFSKDQVIIDVVLSSILTSVVIGILNGLSVAISIAVVNPYTLILFAITLVLMWILMRMSTHVL